MQGFGVEKTPKIQRASVETRAGTKGSNQSGLKERNERVVLSMLRTRGAMAKAEIARATGLSAQSASVIMRRLESEGLIERCAPVRGKVGQPSVPMKLAPDGALFFGLKVGRRSSDMVLVDFLGNVIEEVHQTYRYPEPDGILRFAKTVAEEFRSGLSPRRRDNIAGLGISIPGYLWQWAQIIGEPPEKMAAWRDRDFLAEIKDQFDLSVFLQNDASCACGAELVFGEHARPSEMLYFYLGYFVGGGIVLNGALFTGPTGNAGALAPISVPTPNHGVKQLIDVASLSVLEKSIQSSGASADAIWNRSMDWGVAPKILDEWIESAADGLSHAILSAFSVIDFELVVIDGWLPSSVRKSLVEACQRKISKLDLSGLVQPDIREGTIGPHARALGAASLPLSHRFMISLPDA